MALTPEEEKARLDRIATLLIHLLPGGWGTARLGYEAFALERERLTLTGRQAEGRGRDVGVPVARAGRLLPRSGVVALLRELKKEMYDPDRGTWLAMTLTLRSRHDQPRWDVSYTYPEEFTWPEEPPRGAGGAQAAEIDAVSPRACAAELQLFPRPPDVVPGWMRRPAALQEAARRFDPEPLQATPLAEGDLVRRLGGEGERLFPQARVALRAYAPRGAGRLLIGRPADGCWSVLRVKGDGDSDSDGWLAVRLRGGVCDSVVAFTGVRAALAHAMAQIMAEEKVEINSALLEAAGLLAREGSARRGESAWRLTEAGRSVSTRTLRSPRPEPSAQAVHAASDPEREAGAGAGVGMGAGASMGAGTGPVNGPYLALAPLNNRPYEYFVATPGEPPAEGGYISVQEVFEHLALRGLPRPPSRAAEERGAPPSEILRPGTEVDAYGDPVECFVYTVGTPLALRGALGVAERVPYHLYRVVRPIRAFTGRFVPWIEPDSDPAAAREPSSGPWQGFYLAESIQALVESGHLVEIGGPGGDPIGPAPSDPAH